MHGTLQESSPEPQFESIISSILSLMVQLSHPHMTTGKIIALTRRAFVGKAISLLFNTLSGFVIAILPRSKRLLISWLRSSSSVIVEPKKIKSVTVSIVSPLPSQGSNPYSLHPCIGGAESPLDYQGVMTWRALNREDRIVLAVMWKTVSVRKRNQEDQL